MMIWVSCLAMSGKASAQILETATKTDTLTIADRIAVRTNALDWMLTVPNIGVEFDLGNRNYSRWTVGLNMRGNWQTKHTFNPGLVFNTFGMRAEVRNYWRMRKNNGRAIKPHTSILGKVFSRRRDEPKHPLTTYYIGGYVSYDKISLKYDAVGRQGTALNGGVSMGIVRPIYVFGNGTSIDIDLGFLAGVTMLDYNTYRLDRESNCYVRGMQNIKKILPMVNDINVSLVYRFGKKPVTSKYRWKYDCDQDYQLRMDSIVNARGNAKINKRLTDSMLVEIEKDFKHVYDSVAAINKKHNDSVKVIKDAAEKEAKVKAKEDKKNAKEAAAREKAEARERKKTEAKEKEAAAKEEKKKAKEARKEDEDKEKKDGKEAKDEKR